MKFIHDLKLYLIIHNPYTENISCGEKKKRNHELLDNKQKIVNKNSKNYYSHYTAYLSVFEIRMYKQFSCFFF